MGEQVKVGTKGPYLSNYIRSRLPSAIRVAGIRYAARTDGVEAVNVAIGNVSLPMHPALIRRMQQLGTKGFPFENGVVKYTPTVGEVSARQAFLNIIRSSGFDTDGLFCQITDGGSQAMELMIVACCGEAGTRRRPLLLIDPAYTNYKAFASRLARHTVSVTRTLGESGKFSLPSLDEIEEVIIDTKPGAIVVIPYDNPTGQFYPQETLVELARLCVKHDLWIVSDEAYRELYYTEEPTSSIWGVTERDVPGIEGRRISIETASKVWNGCGLRIGALITDNLELHQRCVAENTAALCSSALGQYIFAALAEESHQELHKWYQRQREYYSAMALRLRETMHELWPELIVSSPDAAIYCVVDVRRVVPEDFDAFDFVMYCAERGKVELEDGFYTLLTAPMSGFYSASSPANNPGRTQMRLAFVESPERMRLVPRLLVSLLKSYLAKA